tara:strand:- start:1128 stop:1958 length:831 start_codon:yes stop_codon:yes gene_type:complete
MIIWLSSYPKSGNTWVRLFLDNLLSPDKEFNINHNLIGQFPLRNHFLNLSDNINDQDEFAKNCVKAQQKLNLDNSLKIFKTHNAFWNWGGGEHTFTNEENTLGVIYIVRDPRNIITSVLNYFHKKNYYEALKFMKENKVLGGDEAEIGLPTIIGSWSNHYKSWKKFKKNFLIIKYENLLKDPLNEFSKIINYLETITDLRFENKNILKAIEECKFDNMSKQENEFGFNDNSKRNKELNKKFFNLGPNNKWQNILDSEILQEIEKVFKTEMEELGYL